MGDPAEYIRKCVMHPTNGGETVNLMAISLIYYEVFILYRSIELKVG